MPRRQSYLSSPPLSTVTSIPHLHLRSACTTTASRHRLKPLPHEGYFMTERELVLTKGVDVPLMGHPLCSLGTDLARCTHSATDAKLFAKMPMKDLMSVFHNNTVLMSRMGGHLARSAQELSEEKGVLKRRLCQMEDEVLEVERQKRLAVNNCERLEIEKEQGSRSLKEVAIELSNASALLYEAKTVLEENKATILSLKELLEGQTGLEEIFRKHGTTIEKIQRRYANEMNSMSQRHKAETAKMQEEIKRLQTEASQASTSREPLSENAVVELFRSTTICGVMVDDCTEYGFEYFRRGLLRRELTPEMRQLVESFDYDIIGEEEAAELGLILLDAPPADPTETEAIATEGRNDTEA